MALSVAVAWWGLGCAFFEPDAASTTDASQTADSTASDSSDDDTSAAEAGSTSAGEAGTTSATDSAQSDESGTTADTGGPPPGEMRVATFNVRLFFDRLCQSGNCGGNNFEQVPSQSEFDNKLQTIALGIRELDADVVLLQEVETQWCLDRLMEALAQDGYVQAVLGETGPDGSIDVATVSRVPFDAVLEHGSQALPLPDGSGTTWFTREFLEVRLTFGGVPVSVFNAHFKSKVDDDPERRLAEAIAAERIVTTRADAIPDGLVVFGGDLNDTPGSEPLDAIEGPGELFRVASELTFDATHSYMGQRRALDHLFVAPAASGGEYISGSAEIFYGPVFGFAGSDHAAVRASFDVGGL